jgi:hypothetical protein
MSLQALLNARGPTSLPELDEDGIFGPKTMARVMEFQRNNGLQVDGIVGPQTWGALEATPGPQQPLEFTCGTGDPANQDVAQAIRLFFLSNLGQVQSQQRAMGGMFRQTAGGPSEPGMALVSFPGLPGLPSLPTPSLPSLVIPPGVLPPTPGLLVVQHLDPTTQIPTAKGVFGSSINFSSVFISNVKGPTGRPFTMALNLPVLGIIQVMNMGTLTPTTSVLIHELTHVWQSQHHSKFTAFEGNALKSQTMAATANAPFAADPTVNTNPDFPSDFPFSAYAYLRPGKAFGDYAAEQIAQQVQNGEAPIVSHVSSVAAGAIDKDNETSLGTARIENRFNPLVKI